MNTLRSLSLPVLALLTAVWIGSVAELPSTLQTSDPRTQLDDWRRTTRGWERISSWKHKPQVRPPAWNVHPGLVAGFVVLVSYGSLLALPSNVKTVERS